LFAGFGSLDDAEEIVAVSVWLPADSVPLTVALTVDDVDAPDARAIGPTTAVEGLVQLPPVTDVQVNPDGNVSVTTASGTSDGPLFVAVSVYVTVPPGATVVVPVFVTLRSAGGNVIVSLSVAVLSAGFRSTT
jgi:hypothetical protein